MSIDNSGENQTGHLRLSELASKIRGVITASFSGQHFWVVAEISGHKFYQDSNRHYLDLVEKLEGQTSETAKIRTTVWNECSAKIGKFEEQTGQQFKDGLQVLVQVRVEFHIVYGLSLIIEDIDPTFTLGNLQRQRLFTLKRLVDESHGKIRYEDGIYYTPNKACVLKSVLQKIALVASPNSEGLHDFMNNIRHNQFGYTFQIDHYFSSVQGAAAEEELKRTMVRIYDSGVQYDCVVIIRGGGAKTDFLAFDTYGISLAVARFPVPVITGIGHFRDVSITDLMAHTSTNAPTKAAEFIILHNRNFEEAVLKLRQTTIIRSQQILSARQNKLNTVKTTFIRNLMNSVSQKKERLSKINTMVVNNARSAVFSGNNSLMRISAKIAATPTSLLLRNRQDLNFCLSTIKTNSFNFLKQHESKIKAQSSLMRVIDPRNLLQKGFALVKFNGRIIAEPQPLENGQKFTLLMHQTEIDAEVISKIKKQEHEL